MPIRLTVHGPDAGAPGYDVRLGGDVVRIGRRADADLRLPHPTVSLDHARIERQGDAWRVADAGSSNGTQVGGALLGPGERRALRDGDTVRVGQFTIVARLRAADDDTRTESTDAVARRLVEQALAASGPDAPAPAIEVLSGPRAGERVMLECGRGARGFVIGRAEACDLGLDDPDVSREHARLRRDVAATWIADLGSKNGVWVAGRRIEEERRLHDGDEILIGATRLRFRDPAEAFLRELESVADRPCVAAPSEAAPTGRAWLAWIDLAFAALGLAALVAAAIAVLLGLSRG